MWTVAAVFTYSTPRIILYIVKSFIIEFPWSGEQTELHFRWNQSHMHLRNTNYKGGNWSNDQIVQEPINALNN